MVLLLTDEERGVGVGQLMETGNKDQFPSSKDRQEERVSLEGDRNKLVAVELSLMDYVRVWSQQRRQYLPDSPVIPMTAYSKGGKLRQENHSDLIAVQHLRGERLFVQRDRTTRLFSSDPEFTPESVNVPSSFIKKDSYLVLLIPGYNHDDIEDKDVKGWDITVLQCVSDHELLKLASVNEWIFRDVWNLGVERRKLVLPKMTYDHFPELMTVRVNDGQESVNIWIGDKPIKFIFDTEGRTVMGEDESHYRRTVNGSICYRLVEGKAEREKPKDRQRSLKLVPQAAGSI